MGVRIKNFFLNELFFLFLAPSLVMLGVVIIGIFFDTWYNDPYEIFMTSGALYLTILFIRAVSWLAKKIRN
jgi:hypothetical protein